METIDLGNSLVNMLMEELGNMRQGVMQLSIELRSKVDPLSPEKAATLITRLRNDVNLLIARHEALAILSTQINRAELLDLAEARLDATDDVLDYVEHVLQEREGLEPVKLDDEDVPDISAIGIPRKANGDIESVPEENANGMNPVSDALPPRTPGRSELSRFAMVTPARPVQRRRNDDSLPPTPKLADFGLSETSLANIEGAFGRNLHIGQNKLSFSLDEQSDTANFSRRRNVNSHIIDEATSPAVDEDENDETYDETISKTMQRMRLRPTGLDVRMREDDENIGDETYDETIHIQMEKLGLNPDESFVDEIPRRRGLRK